MIFSTYWFGLFAAAFFPLYWLCRPPGLRLALLLAACALFHFHFAGPAGVAPIAVLAVLTYAAGCSQRRWALRATMAAVILTLVFYKYGVFLTGEILGLFSPAAGRAGGQWMAESLPAAPPLALSFFAFEFVHYLYDVSHGAPPLRHPARFTAFTLYFPSLVAGPIKRYQPFLASLQAGLTRVRPDDVKLGLLRVATGCVKKIVIADNLTAAIDFWLPQFAELPLAGRWAVLGLIGLRILTDFSGYSDIAIGLGLMMGIRLPENFNWPYLATNLPDFWHRWHISLSTWIRDYVYIPLGGNRHGAARRALYALAAFALCGLWHGAAWNFVLWGVYHGAGLAIGANYAAVLGRPGRGLAAIFARFPVFAWALTMLFVFLGWLLFFHPLPDALRLGRLLFGFSA
jgi:alginate O-acetyltransferase complex protein AlgI